MNATNELPDTQAPPEELGGSTPRHVSASQDTVRAAIICIFIILSFGGLTVWKGVGDYRQFELRTALRNSHQTVTGTVIELHHSRYSETVRYNFSIANVSFSGHAKVPSKVHLNSASQLEIRYLASNPSVNHPDLWEWSFYDDALIPALFSCFATSGGWIGLVMLLRTRGLVSYGRPAAASVQNCVREKNLYHIEYSFRTEVGNEETGKDDFKEPIEIGTTIWILYLAHNPGRNCIYPSETFDVL